jgi:ABC-type lipoprotein export system ATPase subunit
MSIKIYVKYVKNNRDFHTTKLNLPTGNLDETTAAEITKILKESAHEYRKCVIIVTHSDEVARASDCVLEIRHGTLKERK